MVPRAWHLGTWQSVLASQVQGQPGIKRRNERWEVEVANQSAPPRWCGLGDQLTQLCFCLPTGPLPEGQGQLSPSRSEQPRIQMHSVIQLNDWLVAVALAQCERAVHPTRAKKLLYQAAVGAETIQTAILQGQ